MNKLLFLLLFITTEVRAASHELVTSQRSTLENYVYFQQSAEIEFGTHTTFGRQDSWNGSSVTSSLGVEVWRFLELETGYSQIIAKNTKDHLETINGSRFHLGARFDFNAPLFNLEIGAGAVVDSFSYVNHEYSTPLHGTGKYLSLGIDHFFTQHFSVFSEGKYLTEKLTRPGESEGFTNTTLTSISSGFRIWF